MSEARTMNEGEKKKKKESKSHCRCGPGNLVSKKVNKAGRARGN